MHWDGSVSVGNILTFLGMVAFILGAANRFAGQQKEQHQLPGGKIVLSIIILFVVAEMILQLII